MWRGGTARSSTRDQNTTVCDASGALVPTYVRRLRIPIKSQLRNALMSFRQCLTAATVPHGCPSAAPTACPAGWAAASGRLSCSAASPCRVDSVKRTVLRGCASPSAGSCSAAGLPA